MASKPKKPAKPDDVVGWADELLQFVDDRFSPFGDFGDDLAEIRDLREEVEKKEAALFERLAAVARLRDDIQTKEAAAKKAGGTSTATKRSSPKKPSVRSRPKPAAHSNKKSPTNKASKPAARSKPAPEKRAVENPAANAPAGTKAAENLIDAEVVSIIGATPSATIGSIFTRINDGRNERFKMFDVSCSLQRLVVAGQVANDAGTYTLPDAEEERRDPNGKPANRVFPRPKRPLFARAK